MAAKNQQMVSGISSGNSALEKVLIVMITLFLLKYQIFWIPAKDY